MDKLLPYQRYIIENQINIDLFNKFARRKYAEYERKCQEEELNSVDYGVYCNDMFEDGELRDFKLTKENETVKTQQRIDRDVSKADLYKANEEQ